VAVLRPGELSKMGYPVDSKKPSVHPSSGRSQSHRTPRRLARQFAPAGWTMCECEADKEWILCDRTEAVAGELAEQFQKHLMQASQEALTMSLAHDKEDLPEIHSSAQETTMARFGLQLQEEEREALRECNRLKDERDGDENTNTLNERSSAMAKEHIVSAQIGGQTTEDVSASDEENYCVNKAFATSTEGSTQLVTAKRRNSSRRRRADVRSDSQHAESGHDSAAPKNDRYDAPSRKLSRAERRAANADELASQDLILQQSQGQGKVDTCDVRMQSHESPACPKSRAKSRKSQ